MTKGTQTDAGRGKGQEQVTSRSGFQGFLIAHSLTWFTAQSRQPLPPLKGAGHLRIRPEFNRTIAQQIYISCPFKTFFNLS